MRWPRRHERHEPRDAPLLVHLRLGTLLHRANLRLTQLFGCFVVRVEKERVKIR